MLRPLAIALLLLLALPLAAAAQKPLVVGVPCLNIKNCGDQYTSAILRETFSRAGIPVKVLGLPPLRDLEDADALTIDASGFRIPEAIARYRNLIPVKTPVLKATMTAATARQDLNIRSWADLGKLTAGFVRGNKYAEIMLGKECCRLEPVNSLNTGLRMLAQGRLDVLVSEEFSLRNVIKAENLKGIRVSEPLYSGNYHLSLHRSHAELIPRLEKALESMIRDGTIRRLLGPFGHMAPSAKDLPEK